MSSVPHPVARVSGELQEAWSDFVLELLPEIDGFGTFTFKHPQHDATRAVAMFQAAIFRWRMEQAVYDHKATRDVKTIKNKRGEEIQQVRYRGPAARAWSKGRGRPIWVLGVEQHKNGSNHLHALVQPVGEVRGRMRRRDLWRIWHEGSADGGMGIGRCRIDPPDDRQAVATYVSKYVCKPGGELYLSPDIERQPLSAAMAARDGQGKTLVSA